MSQDFSAEEVHSFLEAQVNQAKYDLVENLLPKLGHSQKERLLLAMIDYPTKEIDFSADKDEMIQAYSALKICFDANVVLGVSIVNEEQIAQNVELIGSKKGE
mgnify:CR=1 FL=1